MDRLLYPSNNLSCGRVRAEAGSETGHFFLQSPWCEVPNELPATTNKFRVRLAPLSLRHRRLQSEVLYERIEILVAVKQCQSLLNAARRDQRVDGFSDGDAK
jgi:hypothetical protein